MENNKNNNSSILKEAVADYKSILEAADKKALDRLKKVLPEKFDMLLKEEFENIKKESVEKESDKDEEMNESHSDEDKKTDDEKESVNETQEIDLRELSIDDIEEAYNEATSTDEFEVSPDEINLDDIADELSAAEEMTNEMENHNEGVNDPFDKLKEVHKMIGEMVNNKHSNNEEMSHNHDGELNENVSPSELEQMIQVLLLLFGSVGSIAGVHQLLQSKFPNAAKDLESLGENKNESYMQNENEQMLDENVDPNIATTIAGILGVVSAAGGISMLQAKLKEKHPKIAAQLEKLASSASGGIKGGVTSEGEINEENHAEDDSHSDKEIDEAHGQSYSAGKVRAGSLPNDGAGYRDREGHSRNRPQWSNESVQKFMKQKENMEKRMTSLIEENKKVTKELNEAKKNSEKFDEISKDQLKLQEALVKYRDQLTEMALYNTNIAHVNNILVNENLALTSDDKKNIINRFKDLKSIDESEKLYKSVLSEMTEAKKTLDESVEDKVNDSIEPSTTENINEQVSEKTAYKNEHVDKIKRLMEYVDNHGSKKIL